jgi:hypothetical protein
MRADDRIRRELRARGLLLKQDKRLPNVVTLVTGESLATSWWSHPSAREIFALLSRLADQPDVLFAKLLFGKVTLVHRRLWPAFLSAATSGEDWQKEGLSDSARRLFLEVRRKGAARASGPTVQELERRFLLRTEEIHTESGRHETVLEEWATWARRVDCVEIPSAERGKVALEQAALSLGAALSALPWHPIRSRPSRSRAHSSRRRSSS